MVKNLSFDWKKVGENAGSDRLEVNVCGHVGEVYKAFDNMQWVVRVDMEGKRPFESESAAKQFVEEKIQAKLVHRFKNATADLALFNALKLDFSNVDKATPHEAAMANYQKEFGVDFDLGFNLAQFPQLTDKSWHNDSSPSFTFTSNSQHYVLWVSDVNPEKRDFACERYTVLKGVDIGTDDVPEIVSDNDQADVFSSESPEDLITFLNQHAAS